MKFYLMRHCQAVKGEQLDPTRELTDVGWKQVDAIAEFLDTQTNDIGAVLCSSDLKRGRDTGEELAKQLGVDVVYSPLVDPPSNDGTVEISDVRKFWKLIQKQANALEDGKELLVVSHGPLVNATAAWLIGSDQGDRFHFSHGAVARYDTEDPDNYEYAGRGEGVIAYLHWMVSVKVMVRALEQDDKAVIEAGLRVIDSMMASLGVRVDEAGGEYYMDDVTLKRWIADGGSCDDCDENEAEGWIEESEFFPAGDSPVDEPPLHPNCGCEVEYKDTTKRVYL